MLIWLLLLAKLNRPLWLHLKVPLTAQQSLKSILYTMHRNLLNHIRKLLRWKEGRGVERRGGEGKEGEGAKKLSPVFTTWSESTSTSAITTTNLFSILRSCHLLLFFLVCVYLTSAATTQFRKLYKHLHDFKCANRPDRINSKAWMFKVQQSHNGWLDGRGVWINVFKTIFTPAARLALSLNQRFRRRESLLTHLLA